MRFPWKEDDISGSIPPRTKIRGILETAMKCFTKKETISILFVLLVLGIFSAYNFRISLRRGRDSQRKNDLGSLTETLIKYQIDFGTFPLASSDGKILACPPVTTKGEGKQITFIYSPCEWGKDGIYDLSNPKATPYLKSLPIDPQNNLGVSYHYFSNGGTFQIYASLEGKDDDEYNPTVAKRNLSCGVRVCNFGKAYGKTPVDKSIEEYENELNEKK